METYLRNSISNFKNKQFTLNYLNNKGETKNLKNKKDLFKLCIALMDESELIENGIIEQFTYDIDNSCRYAWGFNIKQALFTLINNIKDYDITLIQATYNKEQIYSINNEKLDMQELKNVKQQRDVYKKQVDVQKEIIKIYENQDEDDEELEV